MIVKLTARFSADHDGACVCRPERRKDLKRVSGIEMRDSSAQNDGSKKEILRAKEQPSE